MYFIKSQDRGVGRPQTQAMVDAGEWEMLITLTWSLLIVYIWHSMNAYWHDVSIKNKRKANERQWVRAGEACVLCRRVGCRRPTGWLWHWPKAGPLHLPDASVQFCSLDIVGWMCEISKAGSSSLTNLTGEYFTLFRSLATQWPQRSKKLFQMKWRGCWSMGGWPKAQSQSELVGASLWCLRLVWLVGSWMHIHQGDHSVLEAVNAGSNQAQSN